MPLRFIRHRFRQRTGLVAWTVALALCQPALSLLALAQGEPLPEASPDALMEAPLPMTVPIGKEESLQYLIRDGLLPPETVSRTAPVTRAEFAHLMVHAVGYNTQLFTPFPFYRDVPRQHWAYVPIEVGREKRLIDYDIEDGFYRPDDPVLFSDLYRTVGRVLTVNLRSMELNQEVAASFQDGATLPEDLVVPIARMTNAQFFPPTPEQRHTVALRPDEPISVQELAPFVVRLMQITGSHVPHAAALPGQFGILLPAGLNLSLTPTSSIFRARLNVGDSVAFSLVHPQGPLPKGSRFKGRVASIQDQNTVLIELTDVRTPTEDVAYTTYTPMTVVFPRDDRHAFITPGQVFEATSQTPSAMNGTPSSGPPPIPPEASSGSTSAPSSAPRSPESPAPAAGAGAGSP